MGSIHPLRTSITPRKFTRFWTRLFPPLLSTSKKITTWMTKKNTWSVTTKMPSIRRKLTCWASTTSSIEIYPPGTTMVWRRSWAAIIIELRMSITNASNKFSSVNKTFPYLLTKVSHLSGQTKNTQRNLDIAPCWVISKPMRINPWFCWICVIRLAKLWKRWSLRSISKGIITQGKENLKIS